MESAQSAPHSTALTEEPCGYSLGSVLQAMAHTALEAESGSEAGQTHLYPILPRTQLPLTWPSSR